MDTRENVGTTDSDGTPFADDIVAVMNDVTDTVHVSMMVDDDGENATTQQLR
jgi:hypothetical protein